MKASVFIEIGFGLNREDLSWATGNLLGLEASEEKGKMI